MGDVADSRDNDGEVVIAVRGLVTAPNEGDERIGATLELVVVVVVVLVVVVISFRFDGESLRRQVS